MKTIKTTMIAIAVIFLANFAYSSGNVKLNVAPTESERAYVEISNTALTQFEIDVRDEFGDLIFRKKTLEPVAAYKKKYDFSALEDGIYTLKVKSENETNQKRFKIERGEITILDMRKVVEPYFTTDGNIWKMSYLNFPMEKTSLYVYDRSQLLFEKEIKPEFALHEGLDLSGLNPGRYQVVFTTPYDIFEHEVTVK